MAFRAIAWGKRTKPMACHRPWYGMRWSENAASSTCSPGSKGSMLIGKLSSTPASKRSRSVRPRQCTSTSSAVEPEIVVTPDHVEELLEQPRLFGRAVGPERVLFHDAACFDGHPQQVVEAAFGVALDIEIDPCRGNGQLRGAEHVDLFLPDGEGL